MSNISFFTIVISIFCFNLEAQDLALNTVTPKDRVLTNTGTKSQKTTSRTERLRKIPLGELGLTSDFHRKNIGFYGRGFKITKEYRGHRVAYNTIENPEPGEVRMPHMDYQAGYEYFWYAFWIRKQSTQENVLVQFVEYNPFDYRKSLGSKIIVVTQFYPIKGRIRTTTQTIKHLKPGFVLLKRYGETDYNIVDYRPNLNENAILDLTPDQPMPKNHEEVSLYLLQRVADMHNWRLLKNQDIQASNPYVITD